MILAGLLGFLSGLVVMPEFAEEHFSSSHHITSDTVKDLRGYRANVLVLGASLILVGTALLVTSIVIKEHPGDVLVRLLNSKYIVFLLGISLWAVLYVSYLLKHTIPVNPGGFYLESARQLVMNGFLIPKYVEGFGVPGIPFVFPPLAFYLLGGIGALVGGVHIAALYVPGLFLPLQALAAYFFMKRWKKSEQSAQWTAVLLMLVPPIFYRTLYGDGITTGLAGTFLLLSWCFSVDDGRSRPYRRCLIGGIFVGLSILSHPGIGLFCTATFTVLCLSQTPFNGKTLLGLILSGLAAFVVIAPWLMTVIAMHGVAPIIAALHDEKSSTSILGNLGGTLEYIVAKHRADGLVLTLIPFSVAMLYNVICGPRVVVLLLVSGVVTFKGHPSVTMFAFAVSAGIFFAEVLVPMFGQPDQREHGRQGVRSKQSVDWSFLALTGAFLAGLAWLCYPYTSRIALSDAYQETYGWVRTNTEMGSTFLMENAGENLVYFGRRTILLPVLGAEWIPVQGYANGLERNERAKEKIFSCRDLECLNDAFEEYSVLPDYLIFKTSGKDSDEVAWITRLVTSHAFEVGLISEPLVTIHRVAPTPTDE